MENIETKEIRYQKAFKETYLIINDLSEELYSKIPKSFIDLITNNMDLDYNISLEDIENDEVMVETKAIMALIYRDYLCDDYTRKILSEQEQREAEQETEKYKNMFKNKKPNDQEENISNKLIIIEKEKWYTRIWNKIYKFCNKKKQ